MAGDGRKVARAGHCTDAAGIICLDLLFTVDGETAEDAAERFRGGEPFLDIFTEVNIDPTLAPIGGRVNCLFTTDVPPESRTSPDFLAVTGLDGENTSTTATLTDPTGAEVAGFFAVFREFDSLEPGEQAAVAASLGDRLVLEDVDIVVDPRIGVYDRASGAVETLR